ncbi:hypothetical protein AHMF7605_11830 [Adhaeribacter arboris]|uniref:Uncharacterized protein n=1 Tax=Adhaeribacter arboris TaxID=2072846 RepID=A0A2T2YF68_9BACT|nr:hypothetical protein [Adhaeribacter arboris]PSR54161.1 hypothetical protein AHMF7605_11830 [Adhaeribacter arboris]
MAVSEERIKARFKERFKTIALANKTLDAFAAKVAPTIVDEAEDGVIDAQLDFFNGLHPDGAFLTMQKADDKAVNDKKKQAQNNNSENQQFNQQNQQQQPPAEMPDWFKPFAQKMEALETEKAQTTIQQKLSTRLKDIPALFYKGRLPKTEEELETVAAEIEADYTAFKQEAANSSANGGPPPRGTGISTADNKVSPAMKRLIEREKETKQV